jgi:lipoprotein-releasing system ATP-binding protein
MTGAAMLSVIGAKKQYGDRVKTLALAAADLSLERGEFVALVGPSGSGKSTLLNLLGLLERPTTGQIILAGQDTTGLDDTARTALRGQMVGFVFQFHHLLPAFTALENVMLPEWGEVGFASKQLRARAEKLLFEVGLADRMSYRVNELSGGQQQRVAVARALARNPPIVLADEPTGNLDTESSREVFGLLRRFNVEAGATFLIVTHDPRVSEQCDRVVELIDGRIHSDRLTRNGMTEHAARS